MREIKFRAWTHQGFIYRELPQKGFMASPIAGTPQPREWQQYTGLKDKNGVEIYEGDIVSCEQAQDFGFKVVGVVHYGIDDRSDWPDPRIFLDTRPFEKHGSEFCIFHKHPEVIGNIYENPELLK